MGGSEVDVEVERAERAVARLVRFYRPGAGRFVKAPGEAWQLALAIEAVITAYQRTGGEAHRRAVLMWFDRHGGRRSRFYDDDGWYLNAWLRGYEATGDERLLAEARSGFADMLTGWDDTCGGGLWWRKDRVYKNAISNALFLTAAARLTRLSPEIARDWAVRAWRWFDGVGLINDDHLVNDGLENCRNNCGTVWTYNQGMVISGLVELSRATGDTASLERAGQIARASLALLTAPDGILREPSEPGCDRDQEIFKGILAQGIARLCRADPADTADLAAALRANADSVWRRARDPHDGLALSWAGPPDRITPATHASATLLLVEAAQLPAQEPSGSTTV
jgi:predicted alpha-1,6-mannanase (GH76 family)